MSSYRVNLDRVVTLAKEYGATRLILFGSTLEDPTQARDLDLACDGIRGWQLYALGARLEDELAVPVDIVPLSPRTRFIERIERRGRVLI